LTLAVSDSLVDEVGDVAIDRLVVDETHWFLDTCLAEEALAVAKHDRVHAQTQLVDEVVL